MRIGNFEVTRLPELVVTEGAGLFPDLDLATITDPRLLAPPFHDGGLFRSSIHLWLLQGEGRVILVDAGAGAGKDRPLSPRFHRLEGRLDRLLAPAGVTAAQVTDVALTHLHVDHVGWCTTRQDGEWRPSFPTARHWIPAAELAAFAPEAAPPGKDPRAHLPWQDSIAPLLAAGLVTPIAPGDRIGPLLALEAAGHTAGQLAFLLEQQAAAALFAADMLHQPLQILLPQVNSRYCALPETAVATRRRLLALAADCGAVLLPAHFDLPCGVLVRRAGAGFDFTLPRPASSAP